MKNLSTSLAIGALAAACFFAPAAQATTVHFHQGGFDDGATLAGSFTGFDEDSDGWIYAYELSEFSLEFTGNSRVSAFSHGMDERAGLVFKVDQMAILHLATVERDADDLRTFGYDAFGWPTYDIPGRVEDFRSGAISITSELLRVSTVPAPQSLALALAALTLAGAASRRNPNPNPNPQES